MLFPLFYQIQSGTSMCFSCNNHLKLMTNTSFPQSPLNSGLSPLASMLFLHTNLLKRLSLCFIVSQRQHYLLSSWQFFFLFFFPPKCLLLDFTCLMQAGSTFGFNNNWIPTNGWCPHSKGIIPLDQNIHVFNSSKIFIMIHRTQNL